MMGRRDKEKRLKRNRQAARDASANPLGLVRGRTCGECRECCTALGVLALAKAENTPCRHQGCAGDPGCIIYARRPKPCKLFRCAWLEGFFTVDDRPDKSRVMVTSGVVNSDVIQVWSLDPDAIDAPLALRAIRQFGMEGMRVVQLVRPPNDGPYRRTAKLTIGGVEVPDAVE